MTTSVTIKNDSPVDGKHASVFVGLRYEGSTQVNPCTSYPLKPGEEVTTTVYQGMHLVIREVS